MVVSKTANGGRVIAHSHQNHPYVTIRATFNDGFTVLLFTNVVRHSDVFRRAEKKLKAGFSSPARNGWKNLLSGFFVFLKLLRLLMTNTVQSFKQLPQSERSD